MNSSNRPVNDPTNDPTHYSPSDVAAFRDHSITQTRAILATYNDPSIAHAMISIPSLPDGEFLCAYLITVDELVEVARYSYKLRSNQIQGVFNELCERLLTSAAVKIFFRLSDLK